MFDKSIALLGIAFIVLPGWSPTSVYESVISYLTQWRPKPFNPAGSVDTSVRRTLFLWKRVFSRAAPASELHKTWFVRGATLAFFFNPPPAFLFSLSLWRIKFCCSPSDSLNADNLIRSCASGLKDDDWSTLRYFQCGETFQESLIAWCGFWWPLPPTPP